MNPNRFLSLALVAGLLIFTSCDSSDPDDLILDSYPSGQGAATVSGGLETSFTGQAYWTLVETGDTDEPEMFVAIVVDGDLETIDEDNFDAVMVFRPAGTPSTGTVSLDPVGGQFGATYVRARAESASLISSVNGSITISEVTSQRVAASLQFSGMIVTMPNGAGGQATVKAGFNAIYIDDDVVPPGLRPVYEEAVQLAESMR